MARLLNYIFHVDSKKSISPRTALRRILQRSHRPGAYISETIQCRHRRLHYILTFHPRINDAITERIRQRVRKNGRQSIKRRCGTIQKRKLDKAPLQRKLKRSDFNAGTEEIAIIFKSVMRSCFRHYSPDMTPPKRNFNCIYMRIHQHTAFLDAAARTLGRPPRFA